MLRIPTKLLLAHASIGLVVVAAMSCSATATATATATAFPFHRPCSWGTVVDYSQPLEEMPPVHRFSEPEPVWLGGQRLILENPNVRVLTGQSQVGFYLYINRARQGVPSPVQVVTELFRVTREGDPIDRIDVKRRYVKATNDYERSSLPFEFEVSGRPAFYRFDVTLLGAGGRKARFGEYYRVLKARMKVRARVIPTAVSAGGKLRWEVENPGTTWVEVPTEFQMERLLDGQWNSVGDPVRYVEGGIFVPSGLSFGCPYTLPPTLESGRYRLRKSVNVNFGKERVFLLPFVVT